MSATELPRVQVVAVSASPLAAIRVRAARDNLGATITRTLDPVWAFLRAPGATLRTKHNVVVYPGVLPADIEVGVQVDRAFDETSESGVRCVHTPGGIAAHLVHVGPYDQMAPAHEVIHHWSEREGRALAGPSWEIYGDWSDDQTRLETEIYYLLD
jgi:effector-binding domain-containing protein